MPCRRTLPYPFPATPRPWGHRQGRRARQAPGQAAPCLRSPHGPALYTWRIAHEGLSATLCVAPTLSHAAKPGCQEGPRLVHELRERQRAAPRAISIDRARVRSQLRQRVQQLHRRRLRRAPTGSGGGSGGTQKAWRGVWRHARYRGAGVSQALRSPVISVRLHRLRADDKLPPHACKTQIAFTPVEDLPRAAHISASVVLPSTPATGRPPRARTCGRRGACAT